MTKANKVTHGRWVELNRRHFVEFVFNEARLQPARPTASKGSCDYQFRRSSWRGLR